MTIFPRNGGMGIGYAGPVSDGSMLLTVAFLFVFSFGCYLYLKDALSNPDNGAASTSACNKDDPYMIDASPDEYHVHTDSHDPH